MQREKIYPSIPSFRVEAKNEHDWKKLDHSITLLSSGIFIRTGKKTKILLNYHILLRE